jgi:glycosyltransferase involved in cell wall biosynthesis
MFSVPEAAGISFRKKYDWLQERPLAVYAGTLGRINGVEYLANLAKKVQSIDSEIRFLVVGNGREKQKVMTLAKKLNIFEKNFFMISSLPKKEMPKILSAANLVISLFINLPEMWANSANKFFDGLASGTAIAINYHGWQAKLLRETGAGIILDSTNTDLAAYQLTANIRNPKKMKDAGEAAHRLATEQFSRDILAKRLEKILSATVSAAKN